MTQLLIRGESLTHTKLFQMVSLYFSNGLLANCANLERNTFQTNKMPRNHLKEEKVSVIVLESMTQLDEMSQLESITRLE